MSALARLTTVTPVPTGRALQRLAQGRGARLMLRTGFMALAAAGLAALALATAAGLLAPRDGGEHPAAGGTGAPRWSDINHPIALYDLTGTAFSRLPLAYKARRSRPDGAREDVLTFGSLGTAKPFLQLSLLRTGAEGAAPGRPADLPDALAQLAGARDLTATRIRAAPPLDTRLGQVEVADLMVWDGETSTPCLGFRGAPGGGVLTVAGFACGPPGRPVSRAALACAVDRIDLVSAGDDDRLRAVFVAAQRRAGATCLSASPPGTIGAFLVGRRLGWLDPEGDMPPLRGLFEAASRQR